MNQEIPDNRRGVPPWSLDSLTNVGMALTETAARMPNAVAVAEPGRGGKAGDRLRYRQITFGELETHSNQIALGLIQLGISPGTRLALMVPPEIGRAHV